MSSFSMRTARAACLLIVAAAVYAPPIAAAEPLKICVTVPELGDIARQIGGKAVEVTVFARPAEDPHFVEPKPSFIKALAAADVFVQVGMELEAAWAAAIVRSSRNPAIQPGALGFLDASTVVTSPLEVPSGMLSRAQGDVHAMGNPHYLLDPLHGLRVARLLRDRLSVLRPELEQQLARGYDEFRRELGERLFGAELARKYDPEKLASIEDLDALTTFLAGQRDLEKLGGWTKMLYPYRGARVIADHNLWSYFVRRFGLQMAAVLEPKPGISPTTKRLQEIASLMQAESIKVVLVSPYYEREYAAVLNRYADAHLVPMAHQAGARPDTERYVAMLEHNVAALRTALHAAVAAESRAH